jgi:hypothetical protein
MRTICAQQIDGEIMFPGFVGDFGERAREFKTIAPAPTITNVSHARAPSSVAARSGHDQTQAEFSGGCWWLLRLS